MAQSEYVEEDGENVTEINDGHNNSLRHICMVSTVIIFT